MAFAKLLKWFTTDAGKQFSFGASTIATIGTFTAVYVPQTFLLDKYQEIISLYKSGLTVPVSNVLKERFEKALDFCELTGVDRDYHKPFHVVGFDVYSAGSSLSKYGSIIGLPISFTYESLSKIERSAILVGGNTVVWSLPEAQDLLQSLILSEDAQVFAMAKEIKICESFLHLIKSFTAPLCAGATYGISQYINNKYNFYAKPLGLRLCIYTMAALFAAGNYFFLTDFAQNYFEAKSDRELKAKDPQLAKGGAEYYSQILKRNMALRKLLGKDGESLYSALGNENYLFRQKHLPLVQRRDFFTKNVDYEI